MGSATDPFVKTYADRRHRFPTMVRHAGVVIAFAMDGDRRIRYTVLDPALNAPTSMMDVDHWTADPQTLTFAAEIAAVGFGVADQIPLPQVRLGTRTPVPPGQTLRADEVDPFLSTTARLTAAVPFQVVSDGRYVYLLRQAVSDPDPATLDAARATLANPTPDPAAAAAAREVLADHDAMVYVMGSSGKPQLDANGRVVPVVRGTLLVDRFALVGTTLEPKLEVRFQRSRSRTRPASSTDTLGAADLEQRPFVEPTQDLRFVTGLTGGAFAAALAPTAVADVYRWQIFGYDGGADVVRSYSLPRTKDGLFDTLGAQPLTCTDHPDVFSLTPGTCPRPALADPTQVCGKTLVPRTDAGGLGGTALQFPPDTPAVVTLDGAATTGSEFTLEAWIRTDPLGTGERALFTGDTEGGDLAPSVWVIDGTTLRIAFGDGHATQGTTTPPVLTAGEWNHLAVTFVDGVISVYVDASLAHAAPVATGTAPTAAAITRIGGTATSFAGTLDEVRVWSLALTPSEIEAARHRRLIGTEGGLAGYWRFDEGLGSTTFDESAAAARGLLDGPVWVGSDAPVSDPVGLNRSALRLAGRRVTGGLGATVYYQQEDVPTGYTGDKKPLKQAARLMLVAVTSALTDEGPQSVPTGPAQVTALDFGVGSDGRLADLPAEVALADLAVPGLADAGPDPVGRLVAVQAQVATLTDAVTSLTSTAASLGTAVEAITAVQNGGTPPATPSAYSDVNDLLARVAALRERLDLLAHSSGAERSQILAAEQIVQGILDGVLAQVEARRQDLAGQLATTSQTLETQRADLAAAQATLAQLQRLLDQDTALSMPLLHLDARGLTVAGAVLDFAETVASAGAVSAPALLDSALGRVTLYFQGVQGDLLYAYYSTFTGRFQTTLATQGSSAGVLSFVARGTEAGFDDLTVTVAAGPDDARCTVTIDAPSAGVTETWRNAPRDAAALAAILNATAPAPVVVGTAQATSGPASQHTASLVLEGGLLVSVPAGALLQVGSTVVVASAAAARGATSVPITPVALQPAAGTVVRRIAYDPASAVSSRPGADLSHGSLLVAADARAAAGTVPDGTSEAVGASASCQWFASPPGTSLTFDGRTTSASLLARTAQHFNGTSDGVVLAADPALEIGGDITVEAWIHPDRLDGLRDIVVHGPSGDRSHEVYLRVIKGEYQAGSYDGTDHVARVAVPPGDAGTWVHLAGVYGNGRWQLYRNGLLLATSQDAVGAVPVGAGWAIGVDGNGRERFFAGDIDEVKIWSRALDAAEITDGMNRRLAGTEPALAAYWYVVDGALVDHATNRVAVAPPPVPALTSPQTATSPPVLAPLTAFDVAGDLTLETWLNPTSTEDLSQVLVHASAGSSYQLALRRTRTAARFAGGTGGILLPDDPSLRLTGLVTVEAWIHPASADGIRDIVARGYVYGPPAGEVYLRINAGEYQLGRWTNTPATDAQTQAHVAVPTEDVGAWVHLAGTWDGQLWRLYRNGVQIAQAADGSGAVPVSAPWSIGGSAAHDRVFNGDIDEVRIWNVSRSAADVTAMMHTRATGTEPGLLGVWRADGPILRDGGPRHLDTSADQVVTAAPGVLASAFTVLAGVGDQVVESTQSVPANSWSHVAAAYEQHYGLQFGDGGYLDAGDRSGLSVSRDLTIEVGVRLDATGAAQGLVSRGTLSDGTDDDVPYAFSILADGTLELAFEDTTHALHRFRSSVPGVRDTAFHLVAVTRQHRVKVDTTATKPPAGTSVVDTWDEVTFYVDGAVVGDVRAYRGPQVGDSLQPTLIGRVLGPGSAVSPLRGALSMVRIWNKAREAATIGAPFPASIVGLVASWSLGEGKGNTAMDGKGGNDAVLHGAVSWVHTPDGRGSSLVLHLDGRPVPTTPVPAGSLVQAQPQMTIGALANAAGTQRFAGHLAEMRLWRVTRSTEQIQDNLFGQLTEGPSDLVAYYRFDAAARLEDHGLRGNDLAVSAGSYAVSTAPVGQDSPLARNAVLGLATRFQAALSGAPCAAEYAELEASGAATQGVLKRAYGYVDAAGQWHLVTGFKVGDLATEWVGQAQFDPQLIGYIEGAPPVPSENLTVAGDYTGATSVAVTDATTTTYTYGTTRDSGFNATFELSAGEGAGEQSFVGFMEIEAPLGIGVAEVELTTAADLGITFTGKASFETSLSWLSETTSGMGSTRTRVSSLSLTGHQEDTAAYPEVGQRYLPANVGYALVQSQTADVYALRLMHTGTLVAYQMQPNPDIPKDWNIITFPIDPRYTKQGVLDGHVGNAADADYPNALNYSPDLSYFKPIEAYALKTTIDRAEEELSALFAQHDVDPNQLSGGQLPATVLPVKRNLVNTYVWTADGGQFSETNQVLDTYTESVSGAYHFQGLAGGTVTVDVDIFGAAVNFELSAMFGGHLDLTVSKTRDSQRSFEVDVTVGGEQDITALQPDGSRTKQPGKVDAYRWMTFYLEPDSANHDLFFNRVVDPIWLEQSSDPAASALRQARQDAKSPAAWRVMHRVTYVSRVLAQIGDVQAPLDKAIASLDLASNYELIRTIEPYVRGRVGRYVDFAAAARSAIASHLPDLLPHIDEVMSFLVLYFGVTDAPQLRT